MITTNILEFADNIRTKEKDNYRIIPKEDFVAITKYFKRRKPVQSKVYHYPKYRFLFSLLYYTESGLENALHCNMMILRNFRIFKKVKHQKINS